MRSGLVLLALAAWLVGASACAMAPAVQVHQATVADAVGPRESNIVVHYPPPPAVTEVRGVAPGPTTCGCRDTGCGAAGGSGSGRLGGQARRNGVGVAKLDPAGSGVVWVGAIGRKQSAR